MDNTGTLTVGRRSLRRIIAHQGFSEYDVLGFPSALERANEHPIAHAIVEGATERGAPRIGVTDFATVAVQGATGVVKGNKLSSEWCHLEKRQLTCADHVAAEVSVRRHPIVI